MTIIIGTGVLTWDRGERISNRYGTVGLMPAGTGASGASGLAIAGRYQDLPGAPEAAGLVGTLVAHVLDTRDSGHIGDIARGIFPETPTVGDRIVLGTGRLFMDVGGEGGEPIVGLVPLGSRASDWLDPHALYRAHSQTVRLEFEPGEDTAGD